MTVDELHQHLADSVCPKCKTNRMVLVPFEDAKGCSDDNCGFRIRWRELSEAYNDPEPMLRRLADEGAK